MTQEIALLTDINSALWALVYIVGGGVLFYVVKSSSAFFYNKQHDMTSDFSNTISLLLEKERYSEVIKQCHDRLTQKPRDANAYWFLGKAYYFQKNYDKAKESFNKAADINPTWLEEWIKPYLENMRDEQANNDEG